MKRLYSTGAVVASVLTTVAGAILLIAGSIYTKDTAFLSQTWSELFALSIFSIIIGALAILFAIVFLYVVFRQLPALTTLFSGLLLLIGALSIICGTILITGRTHIRGRLATDFNNLLQNYSSSNDTRNSNTLVDEAQERFQCCGVDKATDWKTQLPNGASTPDSCCLDLVPNCGNYSLVRQDHIYLRGCVDPMYFYFHRMYSALIGINFTVVALAICTGVIGFIFERSIREQYQLM